ncbi:hypothetical protein ACFL54_00050 [Planctomycetota bacterium]
MDARLQAILLGLGFDCDDGHKRITRGENFYLAGGSHKTHDRMVDKTLQINQELTKRCKSLEEITPEEWEEIARKVKLFKQ